jgi:hypothetical protein
MRSICFPTNRKRVCETLAARIGDEWIKTESVCWIRIRG